MPDIANDWLTSNAKRIFREYFDSISKGMAYTMKKSSDHGDNLADEEFITDKIIEIINEYDKVKGELLRKRLKETTNFNINIKGWKNNKSIEGKIGADLGIVIDVVGNNIHINKVIIVQSKKGFYEKGHIVYKELIKKQNKCFKGVQQANDMLDITPAAFFFLYNSSSLIDKNKYQSLLRTHFFRSKRFCVIKDFMYDHIIKHHPWSHVLSITTQFFFYTFLFLLSTISSMQKRIWREHSESHIGILVIAASEIAARKKIIDGKLESLLPSCVSLSDFMVDYFLPCFVGDTRASVLQDAGASDDFIDNIITRATVKITARKE